MSGNRPGRGRNTAVSPMARDRDRVLPVPDAARIHPAILVFVNGILGTVSIAALIGIWLDPG
jgi:hypothetical protein